MKKIYIPILYFPRWIDKGFSIRPKLRNEYHACIYDGEKFKKYGEKAPIEQEAWAYNVFCNQGLSYMNYPGFPFSRELHNVMGYCGIGTGSGTPAITDTTFFTYLSYADLATSGEVSNPDTNSINHTTEEYYHRHKFFWDLTEGNGSLTEVGLCYLDTTYNHTITHAMFQDAEGQPITIVKSNDKIMVVTVTVYLERGTSDSGAVLLNDGIDRLIGLNGDRLSWKSGSYGGYTRYSTIYLGNTDQAVDRADCYETSYPVLGGTRSYKNVASVSDAGSGYGKTIYTDWGLEEGNGTWYEVGYRLVIGGASGSFQYKNFARFDLPSGLITENSIVKDNTKKLRITLEVYFTQ